MAEAIYQLSVLIMLVSILISLLRFVLGPHAVDRVIAFDAMTIISLSLIAAIAYLSQRVIYLDVALVYGLLSFLGVVAVARYLERGL